jgi:hypothetical protein
MESESMTERLKNAFHDFLTHVEEFYDKEKEDIGEAVSHARERLHEVEDLTADEVEDVSRDFVAHVQDIGEQLGELREGVRDSVQLDTMYITSGILERLIKVADKTTVGLMELNEEMAKHIVENEGLDTGDDVEEAADDQ